MENITIIIILAVILFLLIILNHITIITPNPQPEPIGGCAGTIYGCCPDQTTPKINAVGSNCIIHNV